MKPLGNGINGNIFRIIYNMYQKLKSCVFPSEQQSDFFHSHCGVRQGENLSSVLFSLFFNDLNDYLQSSNCSGINLSEAFNTAVCRRHGGNWADPESFQENINIFYEYSRLWNLNVNLNKTKILIFRCEIYATANLNKVL